MSEADPPAGPPYAGMHVPVEAAALAAEYSLGDLDDYGRQSGLDFSAEAGWLHDLASVRLTRDLWRDSPLELAHRGLGGAEIPDAQMFRCSVATYRVVRAQVGPRGISWAELEAAVCDPNRRLPGPTTVSQLMGDGLGALVAHVGQGVQLYRRSDPERFVRAAAILATTGCKHWLGTPWWPYVGLFLLREAGDPESEGSRRCAARGIPSPVDQDEARSWVDSVVTRPEDLTLVVARWALAMGIGGFGHEAWLRWLSGRRSPDNGS